MGNTHLPWKYIQARVHYKVFYAEPIKKFTTSPVRESAYLIKGQSTAIKPDTRSYSCRVVWASPLGRTMYTQYRSVHGPTYIILSYIRTWNRSTVGLYYNGEKGLNVIETRLTRSPHCSGAQTIKRDCRASMDFWFVVLLLLLLLLSLHTAHTMVWGRQLGCHCSDWFLDILQTASDSSLLRYRDRRNNNGISTS